MTRILKLSDRIRINVGGVKFFLAPLNKAQKDEITSQKKLIEGQVVIDDEAMLRLYLKYSLKKIEGLKGYDERPYNVTFKDDALTDESIDEVLLLDTRPKLMSAAWLLFDDIDADLTSPLTGDKLEGVKVDVIPKQMAVMK